LRKVAGLLWLAFACATAQAQGLSITFLDVGQGDAALIRSPTGRTVLAIASHNHADHLGGMARVLETIPVRNYMENGIPATTGTYARLVMLLAQLGTPVLRAEPRRIDLGGGAVLRVLSGAPNARTQNDASIGLELVYGSFRALFTGDAEGRQRTFWASADSLGAVQVLKVSHHGSVNGTDAIWLASLSPCAAVISVGARNSFGHPSPLVLDQLASAQVTAYRTDQAGEITVVADSLGAFAVQTSQPPTRTSYRSTCAMKR
jgi:competence protein ComEC